MFLMQSHFPHPSREIYIYSVFLAQIRQFSTFLVDKFSVYTLLIHILLCVKSAKCAQLVDNVDKFTAQSACYPQSWGVHKKLPALKACPAFPFSFCDFQV